MKKYFFSIIIPTLNEEKNLPLLLSSIKKQDYEKNFEVIISDSFSTDKTMAIAKQFLKKLNLKFYQKKFLNVSQARNYGAKKAIGDFLIFFDADVEIEKIFYLK